MKPEEMIKAVEELSREEYDPGVWMQWFNEALQDLTPVLYLETYEEMAVSGNNRELPGDIYLIEKLFLGDEELERVPLGANGTENTYWLWGNKVYFQENVSGTLKLWYYRRPAKFTLGSSSPDIPEGYEDALILYAAAKSKAPDRWLNDKNDFYRDYLGRKAQIQNERSRQKNYGIGSRIEADGWW